MGSLKDLRSRPTVLLLVFVALLFVGVYASGLVLNFAPFAYIQPIPSPGHGGDTVWVDVPGLGEMTLQDAITAGTFSGGTIDCIDVTSSCNYCTATTANCPAGYTVTGGGCDYDADDDWSVHSSQEGKIYEYYVSGNGYLCRGREIISAYARCCRIS